MEASTHSAAQATAQVRPVWSEMATASATQTSALTVATGTVGANNMRMRSPRIWRLSSGSSGSVWGALPRRGSMKAGKPKGMRAGVPCRRPAVRCPRLP